MKSLIKGWFGEKATTFRLWLSLNRDVYRRFDHLILPSSNGTTQIDHLIVSEFGLFIVETKNKTGWIFGSPDQPYWTQVIYDNKYRFQNPLHQTFRQKRILGEFLSLDESFIHTVVYFNGDCKFKTYFPPNVIRSGLGSYIKAFDTPVFNLNQVIALVDIIEHHISESTLTTRDHLHSLRTRHNSKDICPKCGSNLVERTVRNGVNAGKRFLGCSGFPNCRYSSDT